MKASFPQASSTSERIPFLKVLSFSPPVAAGQISSASTPWGTTTTLEAGTPLATKPSFTKVVGVQISSTAAEAIFSAQMSGMWKNSHGKFRTSRPPTVSDNCRGHKFRTVTCVWTEDHAFQRLPRMIRSAQRPKPSSDWCEACKCSSKYCRSTRSPVSTMLNCTDGSAARPSAMRLFTIAKDCMLRSGPSSRTFTAPCSTPSCGIAPGGPRPPIRGRGVSKSFSDRSRAKPDTQSPTP
mmetsp:Transcript_27346/g.69181  ORF Transcript_27346/g.69181 Transcript_27346/m.69181 type:complete len:238 (+) Transcript_27346:941-1654(+)